MSHYGPAILPSREGGFLLAEREFTDQELKDIKLLAQLVMAEAEGEPFWGQVAVAAVVLNRLLHPEFPKTISEVIFQQGQFEVVANGRIFQTPNNSSYEAVLEALDGVDPTKGSLFFWNPAKTPSASWVWSRTIKFRIGAHVFA